MLEKAVIAIQTSKPIFYAYGELYQAVENLCTDRMDAQLYNKLCQLTETHLKAKVTPLLEEQHDEILYLKEVNECWQGHCNLMVMIRSIFLFLDRTYVLQNPSVHSIWDMGLDLFRKHIASDKVVQRRTVNGLLMLIERERTGDTVDRGLLKNLLRMLTDLAIYKSAFEEKFLISTRQLYLAEGQRKMHDLEVPDYLHYVDDRLQQENERLLHYLDGSTK